LLEHPAQTQQEFPALDNLLFSNNPIDFMALLLGVLVANRQFGTSAAVSKEATSGYDLSHGLTNTLCC